VNYLLETRNIYKQIKFKVSMGIKNWFGSRRDDDMIEEDYLEIDLNQEKKDNKVLVKLFTLKDYEDSNRVINALREGYTIAIVDIRILRKKDPLELKRAVSKIKKTAEAMEGSIAGFKENQDVVVITPSFAKIDKEPEVAKETKKRFSDDY
jgi:SepF-like predicted cell division protein (DUF552 family)